MINLKQIKDGLELKQTITDSIVNVENLKEKNDILNEQIELLSQKIDPSYIRKRTALFDIQLNNNNEFKIKLQCKNSGMFSFLYGYIDEQTGEFNSISFNGLYCSGDEIIEDTFTIPEHESGKLLTVQLNSLDMIGDKPANIQTLEISNVKVIHYSNLNITKKINFPLLEEIKELHMPYILDCDSMFKDNKNLKKVGKIVLDKAINISNLFNGCSNLISIDEIIAPKAETMERAFFQYIN